MPSRSGGLNIGMQVRISLLGFAYQTSQFAVLNITMGPIVFHAMVFLAVFARATASARYESTKRIIALIHFILKHNVSKKLK